MKKGVSCPVVISLWDAQDVDVKSLSHIANLTLFAQTDSPQKTPPFKIYRKLFLMYTSLFFLCKCWNMYSRSLS